MFFCNEIIVILLLLLYVFRHLLSHKIYGEGRKAGNVNNLISNIFPRPIIFKVI